MTNTTKQPIEFPPRVPVLLQTTPRLLKAAGACADGYRKALKGAGVGPDDADTPINLLSILDSNDLADFFWAAAHVLPGQEAARDRALRLMAAEFAAEVLPLFEAERPDDNRPRLAIEAARDFAMGEIGAAAWDAAWDAASAAARDAARAAASAAARDAASAARDAAWDAARDAAWAAAWDAASAASAARDAAKAAQCAIVRAYLKGDE